MPRLPDKDALGGIPSLNSGRQGVSAGDAKEDVSGQQATSMALAKGFETLAGGVQRIAEEEIRQEDALDLIRANNQHTQRLNDINNHFDTDNDWRTYRPRFADSATSATAEAGAGIRNAALRNRWIEQAQGRNIQSMDRVVDRGTRLQKIEKELEVEKTLESYRSIYVGAKDEADRARILADIDATVTAAQRTGLIDPARGEAMRQRAIGEALKEDVNRRLMSGDSVGVMRDLGALPPEPGAKPKGRRFKPEIQGAIDGAAEKYGVDRDLMTTIAMIESGGNPGVVTGSYKGLYQLSDGEFRKAGGQGSVMNPAANAEAAAIKLKAESEDFRRKYGRDPSAAEIYLIHQQGVGGADAHWRNPDQLAWQSMASTAEGRQKGERWAKLAIWGNVPDDVKARYGSVENLTSGEFVKLWEDKVDRIGGRGSPSGPYARMSFRERSALVTNARIAMSAETQQDIRDAYQTVMDTGEEPRAADGTTALDRARAFLKPNQVKRAELQIEEARMMHGAVTPLRGMTETEAVEHIRRLQDAGATGERSAMQRRIQQKAEAAWAEIQNERLSDPAEAVDPYTNVRTAKAGRTRRHDEVTSAYGLIKRRYPGVQTKETAAGAVEIQDPADNSPEAWAETHRARRALIDARLEAQAALGVPRDSRMPLTKREADQLVDMPEDVNTLTPQVYRMRLQAAADRAEMRYGKELGPIVLESAMKMRRTGGADHKAEADRIMRRLARGEAVTRADVRSLNDLRDVEARNNPFGPTLEDFAKGNPAYNSPMPEEGRAAAPGPTPLPPPPPRPAMAPQRPTALPPPAAQPRGAPTVTPTPTLPGRPPARPEGQPPPRRTQRGYYDQQPRPNPYDDDD